MESYYKLEYYVPESHLEPTKTAIFESGAGSFDGYDCCCWETLGKGQFRPCVNSNPFIGEIDKLQQVQEIKVETICPAIALKQVVDSLIKAHPYEVVAYQYWPIQTVSEK